jgi:chromosome partitioning protein
MQTIAVASQKGGAGKSTLCLHLSVLAQEVGPTLITDLDPQGSISFWHSRREAAAPLLVESTVSKLPVVIQAAEMEGVRFTFLDTAPHDSASMAGAMRAADFVLIPARPSALDLHAIGATLSMVRELRKPYAVVLMQTPARRGFTEPAAVSEARQVIEGQGGVVSPVYISQRVISAQSIIAGLAVNEIEPDGPAATEYRALWLWTMERLPSK